MVFLFSQVVIANTIYSAQPINFAFRAKTFKQNQTIQKLQIPSKKFQPLSFSYFLFNQLSQLALGSYMIANIFTFVSFIFFSLFCYLLFSHFCRHSSTADKFRKNEDCSYVMYWCFSVSLSSRNFPHIFFFAVYENPQFPNDLKMFCLGY